MVFFLILDLKHDIFGLFLIFKSQLFHNETVDGIQDTIDILSLLLGVVLWSLVLDTVGGKQLQKYWGHNLYAFF